MPKGDLRRALFAEAAKRWQQAGRRPGATGDFDADGRPELALPDQPRQTLAGVRRTPDGAEVAWEVDAGGVISTNLAAVSLPGDYLALGIGREDGTLRLWLPSARVGAHQVT
ncbi:MAG: hypothetical protein HY332_24540 [Chloroflexi bacterium]|nr:hypothetical protein [Chloroflexota bacterium]